MVAKAQFPYFGIFLNDKNYLNINIQTKNKWIWNCKDRKKMNLTQAKLEMH